MKRILLLFTVIITSFINYLSSHISGGDFNIRQLSATEWEFTYRYYYNCNGCGIDPPSNIDIQIYDYSTDVLIQNVQVFQSSTYTDPIVFSSGCGHLVSLNEVCITILEFKDTLTLPSNATGYYVVYNDCCRPEELPTFSCPNDTVIYNISDPSGSGVHLYQVFGALNSTIINSPPQIRPLGPDDIFCTTEEKTIDLSATDLEGDSLSYKLISVLNNGNTPYPEFLLNVVSYDPGFSGQNPFGTDPNVVFNFDTLTGFLTAKPLNSVTKYMFAYIIEEWRNGVKIGEVYRDIILQATDTCFSDIDPNQYISQEKPIEINISNNYEPYDTSYHQFDHCFDIIATKEINGQISNKPINIWLESNAFDYGAYSTLPNPNGDGSYNFSRLDVAYNNIDVIQIADTFYGTGTVGARFCWNTINCLLLNKKDFYLKTNIVKDSCDIIDTIVDFAILNINLPEFFNSVPNSFSPNGDNKNDEFYFYNNGYNFCLDYLTIRIYDRWGKEVYYTEDFKFKWDGKDKNTNKIVTEGTYYAVLQGVHNGANISHNFIITVFK